MTTPEEFYANPGDRFGVLGADRTNPHRGTDFPYPEGTPIPSWCDGTVVRSEFNSVIGYILTIATAGGYAGFCHMVSKGLPVGTKVSYGDSVGSVGNTGSASRGAHLHATFSTTGDHPGTSAVVDPLPWIQSAIKGMTEIPKKKGNKVQLFIVSGEKFYTGVSDSGWIDFPEMPRKANGDMGDVQLAILRLFGANQLWTKEERAAIKSVLPQMFKPMPITLTPEQLAVIGKNVPAATLNITGTAKPI